MSAARRSPPATAAAPNRQLDAFILTVGLFGTVIVARASLALPSTPHIIAWLFFAALAIIEGRFALKIPGINAQMSVSDTFFVASAMLFGPAPATVAIALDSLAISYMRGNRWGRVLFNFSAAPVSFWVASQAFFWVLGAGPLYDSPISADRVLAPLALMALVYFVLNSGLIAIAIGLEKKTSPLKVWRSHLGVVSLNFFAAGSAAFFLFVVVHYVSVIALAAVVPLFAIFHVAMRSWTGRLEDAGKHVESMNRLYLSTITALSTAIEAKDGVTSSHIHRVQHYAMGLASALGISDEETLKSIQAAALLHDTGKLAVPERILNKPGKLTAVEFETMKLHVDVGADILSSIDFPYPVVPIVRAHHENWDGTGYPRGLRGTEIPVGARILSVVDCYDALTSDRPYRAAMKDGDALVIIRQRRGTMYDPAVVDMFERVCGDIAPTSLPAPQLQKALQQISRAIEPVPEAVEMPAAQAADGPEAIMALVNLARIVEGHPTVTDVASVAWSHVRHVVPSASCSFFVAHPETDSVVARFVSGAGARILQGLEIKVGDRLTGWVAENRQPIVNSEAQLDLGAGAALAGLRYCLAVPLVHSDSVEGVLSVYGADAFREEQAQALSMIGPHLGQMLAAAARHHDASATRRAPHLRAVG